MPFVIIGDGFEKGKLNLNMGGALSDVAPTILDVMGIKPPVEMLGKSLIVKKN